MPAYHISRLLPNALTCRLYLTIFIAIDQIRMTVSEGLTCSFEQQAVVIDPERGRYVKLGEVHKTAVVTPDLEKAFNE